MKGVHCARENKTHRSTTSMGDGFAAHPVWVLYPPWVAVCGSQTDDRRSMECFWEFSGLLSAYEVISIKMRMDLAADSATEDAEPRLGPWYLLAVPRIAGNRSCLICCWDQASSVLFGRDSSLLWGVVSWAAQVLWSVCGDVPKHWILLPTASLIFFLLLLSGITRVCVDMKSLCVIF